MTPPALGRVANLVSFREFGRVALYLSALSNTFKPVEIPHGKDTMSHPSFSNTDITLSASAHLEDASVYQSITGYLQFCLKYERKFKDAEGDTHWVNTTINMTREQAESLHQVLGMMLNAPEPDKGRSEWVICSGKFEEQYA